MRMRFIAGIILVLSCVNLYAQEIPKELYGNWLSKDGSNQLIFSLTSYIAVYDNETWTLEKIAVKDHHVQLTIKAKQQTRELDFLLSADKDTVLSEGRNSYAISKILHYNKQFKPIEKEWKTPLYQQGMAHVKVVYNYNTYRYTRDCAPMDMMELQFSYYHPFLGKTVYYFAAPDSNGVHELDIPVFKPQLVEVGYANVPKKTKISFLVERGDSIIMVHNYGSVNKNDKQSVVPLTQFMGDNATFNNLYQFAIPELGFRDFVAADKMPFAAQFKQLNEAMNNMYDPAQTEKRFLTYLREELTYRISDLMNGYITYADFPVIDSLLNAATATSLLHDKFYLCADWISRRHYNRLPEEKRDVSYTDREVVPVAMRDLDNFMPFYLRAHYTDTDAILYEPLKPADVRHNYIFYGRSDENKLAGISLIELWNRECEITAAGKEDSIRFRLNRALIKQPVSQFAANVSTVVSDHRAVERREALPSLVRLDKFPRKYDISCPVDLFCKYQQEVISNYKLSSYLAGEKKLLSIQHISGEASWQQACRFFYGTAVLWALPAEYDEVSVYRQLDRITRLQKQFQDVVFVICIHSDDDNFNGDLTRYLEALRDRNLDQHVIYCTNGNTLYDLFRYRNEPLVMDAQKHINRRYVIDTAIAKIVKPIRTTEPHVLEDQIQGVLDGRILSFESYTKEYLSSQERNFYLSREDGGFLTYKLTTSATEDVDLHFKGNQYREGTQQGTWDYDKPHEELILNGETSRRFKLVYIWNGTMVLLRL